MRRMRRCDATWREPRTARLPAISIIIFITILIYIIIVIIISIIRAQGLPPNRSYFISR